MEKDDSSPVDTFTSCAEEESNMTDAEYIEDDFNWDEAADLADEAHVRSTTIEPPTEQQEAPAAGLRDTIADEQQLANTRLLFKEYCRIQVFNKVKGWDSLKPLPWRSDPRLLKAVTEDFKISKQQAACWWLQLRRSHGSLEPLQFTGDVLELAEQYSSQLLGAGFDFLRSRIVSKCHEQFEHLIAENHEMKMTFGRIFGSRYESKLKFVISSRIDDLCTMLARNTIGMTPANRERRTAAFMKEWQKSIKNKFIPMCYKQFPHVNINETSKHVFVCLELDIYKEWNKAMNRYMAPTPKSEISDEEIEKVILEAGGLVYYLAGWLLFRLKNKLKKSLQKAAMEFVKHNTTMADQTIASDGPPMGELNSREKHVGKLTRVSLTFFNFVKLLEAIYKVNLENPQIVWAFKDIVFVELLKTTTRSIQVDRAFAACLPPDGVAEEERPLLLNILLNLYNKMRAGDFVRRLKSKANERNGATDNLHLRSAVMVTQLMSSGKLPSAIAGGTK